MQSKHASLASETALPQGNVIVQAPHTSSAEQGDPSSHIQPMYETALVKDISTPPLQTVPSTVLSRASTRSKSKIAPHFSLGCVASFIVNLRGQALARQSTCLVGSHRPMLFRDVEGAPMKNTNNVNKRPHPVCTLGRARRPREDGPRRWAQKRCYEANQAN
jgi:hypothetical protein